MDNNYVPPTGADESHYDSRTFKHDTQAGVPVISGGYDYGPADIEHQHNVGICTAISLTQNAAKAKGKKYSADFQYLLQKKYVDLNWYEGSSIFSALKVGKNFGFLPVELFTWVTENDRYLPYSQYIAKLQAIPVSEIQRLIGLCIDKLSGYASVATDAQSLAKGILDSKAGILCRYDVGEEWWTARDGRISWATVDIDPLRPPQVIESGHAISASKFNFSLTQNITHPNTWGILWNDQNKGNGNSNNAVYKPTEAWIPYYDTVPAPVPPQFIFTQDMHYGDSSNDVLQLQKRLIAAGYNIPHGPSQYFGDETRAALIKYQDANGITLTFAQRFIKTYCVAGPKTRAKLNGS